MLRLVLYVPRSFSESPEIKEIEKLLEKVKSILNLEVEKFVITNEEEKELKERILWSLSVTKRIKIKQTRKSKSLYPQLVIFSKNRPLTFYPQARKDKEITIQEFLISLLNGEIKCLHEKYEIEDMLEGEVK